MSTATNLSTASDAAYKQMNRYISTLMHFVAEKLKNGPDYIPAPPSDLKSEEKDATIRYLIDLLPKRRLFGHYRTAQISHDGVLYYWRGLEDLHTRGALYDSYGLENKQVQIQIESILCFIGNARLWGGKETKADKAELKAFEDAAKVVIFPNFRYGEQR